VAEHRPAVGDVGDDADDRAAVRLHPAVEDLAHEDEAAGEVVLHHRLEALGRDRLEAGPVLAAGVVDEAVDAAGLLENARDDADHAFLVADVAGWMPAMPPSSSISAFTCSSFDLAADDRDVGAERRQLVQRCSGRCRCRRR
jgi:hypothetical protein